MIRWSALALRAWPVAALLLFWVRVAFDFDAWPVHDFGVAGSWALIAAASVGVYGAMSLLVAALRDRPARRRRLLGAVAIALLLGTGLGLSPLFDLSAAAVSALLWVAALRLVPRVTLVASALLAMRGGGTVYFGAVLLLLGLVVLPAPVSSYLRELMPRRVGGAS